MPTTDRKKTNEDTDYTLKASDFGFSDPNDNPADSFLSVKITTLPTHFTLYVHRLPISTLFPYTTLFRSSNKLAFTPAANANGAPYATFTFQVRDDGGTANSGVDLDQSANTMTRSEERRVGKESSTNNTVTTNEDTDYTLKASDFGFSDPHDNPTDSFLSVKITTLPTHGTLYDNGLAVAAVDFVTVADIPARNLTGAPTSDPTISPYATFTFQVRDDGGTANSGVDLDQSANTMT